MAFTRSWTGGRGFYDGVFVRFNNHSSFTLGTVAVSILANGQEKCTKVHVQLFESSLSPVSCIRRSFCLYLFLRTADASSIRLHRILHSKMSWRNNVMIHEKISGEGIRAQLRKCRSVSTMRSKGQLMVAWSGTKSSQVRLVIHDAMRCV